MSTGFNFTESVRGALIGAREEANALSHEYVGTEHILLGLIHTPTSEGSRLLNRLGVDIDALRRTIVDIVKKGRAVVPTSDLPYTSRAKKTLELAMTAARDLGHDYIGIEHLLLGLVMERKGIAAQILADRGVTREAIIAKMPELIAGLRTMDAADAPDWLSASSDPMRDRTPGAGKPADGALAVGPVRLRVIFGAVVASLITQQLLTSAFRRPLGDNSAKVVGQFGWMFVVILCLGLGGFARTPSQRPAVWKFALLGGLMAAAMTWGFQRLV